MLSLRRSSERAYRNSARLRLHVGCGQQNIPGWLNIDHQALAGVDQVLDVRQGLPFEDVEAIFAEHFIEHLSLDEAIAFLREARRALSPAGVLRLSTPNLDWVYLTHYRMDTSGSELGSLQLGLQLNRAFYGWGHRFLFNSATLSAGLRSVGFGAVTFCRYGESTLPFLAGLERHEKSEDVPEMPHVLIAEATGCTEPVPLPEGLLADYRAALHVR